MPKVLKPKVLILGGGVTGLTVGWKLSQIYKDQVVILEKSKNIGGLASSHKIGSLQYDVGSHRIHPDYNSVAFKLIKDLIGDDLLIRPRRGLVFIQKKFLSYPTSFSSMLQHFNISQLLKFSADLFWAKATLGFRKYPSTFESFLVSHLGGSLFEAFYKPYALKLWGLSPKQITQEPAKNRIAKFNFLSILNELSNYFSKTKDSRNFYYPRKGIGQISTKIQEKYLEQGGQIFYSCTTKNWQIDHSNKLVSMEVMTNENTMMVIEPEIVISTIPLKLNYDYIHLKSDIEKSPPFPLKSRSLRIFYLIISGTIEKENETFYIPDTDYIVGRVSDIRKYSPDFLNEGTSSILAIEIPFSPGDTTSSLNDDQLSKQILKELKELGIINDSHLTNIQYFSKIVSDLYPIYDLEWKKNFKFVMDRINKVSNLFLIGRSALFLHCNIDHCMLMALSLAEFLKSNQSKNEWLKRIESFYEFRVKD